MRINGKEIFKKGTLMCRLSRMASLEYQDKYIVYPTINKYEDPSEMAEFLYTGCKNALLEQFKFCFLPYERDALRVLVELIDKNFNDRGLLEADDYEYLVHRNPSWIEVRGLALKTLHIFGYKPYSFNYD